MTDDFSEKIAGIEYTQAQAIAHSYILLEILRDLAMQSGDPRTYLARMFERVSSYSDRLLLDEQKLTADKIREQMDRIFTTAGSGLLG